jgi:hypothetical protein
VAVGQHVQRAFVGGAARSRASDAELVRLEAVGITDPLMQGYLAWRRSVLLVAVPFSIFSAALSIRDLLQRELDGYSLLGTVVVYLVYLAVVVLAAAVIVAAVTWRRPRVSGRVLLAGWACSMFVPLASAVIPIDWLLSGSLEAATGVSGEFAARTAVSLQYAILLLPSLLSFPSGLVRGATRVKAMLPASTISGWVLVIMAPVYAVYFVLALILIEHTAGNGVLLAGVLLLASSPFVHLAASKLYVLPLSDEQDVRRLGRVQRLAGAVGVGALALIVIWALTATIDDRRVIGTGDAVLDPVGAVLSALDLVARVLVTSVVFSYLLLQVTEAAWRHDRGFADPAAFERHEVQMEQIGRTLGASGDRLS